MTRSVKYIFGILLILILVFMDLTTGSIPITLGQLIDLLRGLSNDESINNIVLYFRVPKIITAIFAGLFLPVSGLMMQTFFRNPIAGPYILGISSGASLGVATITLLGINLGLFSGLLVETVVAAFIGSLGVLWFLLVIYKRIRDINSLLIIGLMIGSGAAALISLFQYFADQQSLQQFIFWTMGSLQETSYQQIIVLVCVGLLVLWIPFRYSNRMDVLLLGDDYSHQIGLDVDRIRMMMIIVTALLTASVTAFCGPIAFVGIAVPHLARMVFKTYRHLHLLIGSSIIGVIVMLFCDILCHLPSDGIVLPINVVTSMLGVPMVVWIVMTQHKLGQQ